MDKSTNKRQANLRTLILAAEFAVFLAIFAQISIPFGIVPFTGQTLALGLFASIARPKISFSAVALYLLLGAIGLPVFANGSAGLVVLFGPNAGYLFGFLFYVILVGSVIVKYHKWWQIALVNLIAAVGQLLIGTIVYALWIHVPITHALYAGMVVFIPLAIVKVLIVTIVATKIIKRFGIFK
ncbi:biotin transporter BioY [Periweissella fabalis]|uniref:Biotin transporter n=1 Tax=Periweissella fabalis TaxID=1070421 RepID=A0A7X6N183_9LACO|nr:biotin transporter BioY [Periweissella fabalis]MCM0599633.1 biotin transporter BioY [Periweissella fabalis]NKZ23938.1 biotin transporter BioY [Periweissella fabalis]